MLLILLTIYFLNILYDKTSVFIVCFVLHSLNLKESEMLHLSLTLT